MDYNFDEIINRKNTNSLKHDFYASFGKPDGLIPLWVADMDFKAPPQVTDALIKTAEHAVFGYSEAGADYFNAVHDWFASRFSFNIEPDWMVKTPGVVFAICMAINAFTDVSDSVIIQPPVYHPFRKSVISNRRRLVTNPLVYSNGRYSVNLDDFEKKIVENNVKLFILCSPHNPVGRVWTADELTAMGNICLKHNVIIVSDEIHCDFVYEGHKHTVLAAINEDFLKNTITCTAPSKTFNLAGLQASNTFIADRNIRAQFVDAIQKTGYGSLNTMALAACLSAYKYGHGWLDALNAYLAKNLDYIRDFIAVNLPHIKLVEPEGTYLVWLDFNALGLSSQELDRLITHKAGLWVNDGTLFGEEGKGFIRINMACPLETIKKALHQLKVAMA